MPKMSQMLRPEYLNRGTVLSEVDELESEMKGTVYRRDSIFELGSIGEFNSDQNREMCQNKSLFGV